MIVALAPGRQRDAPIALELFRLRMLVKQLRSLSGIGGQIVVTSHAPDVLRCFRPDDTVLLEPPRGRTADHRTRSEERRVGKEGRSQRSAEEYRKKQETT